MKKPIKKYRVYRSGRLVLSTNFKKKVDKEIGKSWAPYEVIGRDNKYVMEYLPF